jgi:hypothetical protein
MPQPEWDSQNKTSRTGQTEQDCQQRTIWIVLRTARAEQPGQDDWDAKARKGEPEQDRQNGTNRIGQQKMAYRTGCQDRTAVQDCHYRIAKTSLPGEDSELQCRAGSTSPQGQDSQSSFCYDMYCTNFSFILAT